MRAGALALCALCVIAAAMVMHRNGAHDLEQLATRAQDTQPLYQIGDQEYLSLSSGSVEDIADEVGKKLGKELIMLKNIERRLQGRSRGSLSRLNDFVHNCKCFDISRALCQRRNAQHWLESPSVFQELFLFVFSERCELRTNL